MFPILWITIALAAALVFVYFSARRARALRPPIVLAPGEKMPTTPMQRLAQWALGVSVVLALLAVAVVVYHGPQIYWDDDRVRLTVMGLVLAMMGVLAFVAIRSAQWMARGDAVIDERDRAVLTGAPAGQAGAILITLAIWQIGLAGTYHGNGQVPMVFFYLVFWSCVVMAALSWLAGIVLGYKRQ
jgi:hypothetical protein